MKTIAIVALLLAAAPAVAKPWQGIEPGQSKRDQVIQKFGEPSRVVTTEGKEVIAYFEQKAIKGTKQVQFKVDPGTKLVERIDVFPGPVIDKESVESTYGPACPSGKMPASPCYQKKLTDDFRTYLLYPRLGLAVFLNEDGKTVHSFIFTPQPGGK
ncbi:hypothetical protein F0U61_34395 [Archangium violaceum]|uniref:hypothetical protein n=1 Tax=Archangium violaceum TaxID=83451 RepID=UPI002B2B0B28|nr:hypothetical protein F0U61_34395 [Archangium violaceum]